MRRDTGMCPMDWLLEIDCSVLLWTGKRNKVVKNTSEQTSNLFTPHVDELCRASTKGCPGCWELGFKRSLLLVHTQRFTKYRENSHLPVKMQILLDSEKIPQGTERKCHIMCVLYTGLGAGFCWFYRQDDGADDPLLWAAALTPCPLPSSALVLLSDLGI